MPVRPTWRWRNRVSGDEHAGKLFAYWEVDGDPISDDYTPDEIDADDLFDLWARQARHRYPDGLVPILWLVLPDGGKPEFMPLQSPAAPGLPDFDFLTYFTWPFDADTGEPLNWLTLPVMDKVWNVRRWDKGGFLQQATGWKPSVLQPHVYLPALVRCRQRA